MNIERLTTPWWALRVASALRHSWPASTSSSTCWRTGPPISAHGAQMLPFSPSSFMHIIGVVEMLVGGVILAGYTRLGGYVAAIWLVGIALNLVTTGHYFDVAVRDVAMAIAAFTLARLTEARASERAGEGSGGLSLLTREKMIA